MSSTSCPLCGVFRRPPPGGEHASRGAEWELPNTPYTDECACTDRQTCFYHQSHLGEYPPARPSDEVMLQRALKRYEWKLAEHKKMVEKFAEYEKLRDEVTALKARVAELEEPARKWQELQTGLAETVRQANEKMAKWPCVCAGYEGPDCLSCKARKALENK